MSRSDRKRKPMRRHRNELCDCGSGIKYKFCCMKKKKKSQQENRKPVGGHGNMGARAEVIKKDGLVQRGERSDLADE